MSQSAPYLKKSANGTWYVHWTENRVGKRISTGAKDLAAAKEFLGTWLLMEREAPAKADRLLSEVWTVYRAKHVVAKVAGQYNADLAWKQLDPHFGHLNVSALSQDVIDEYVKRRRAGRLGRPVKAQTAAKELSYLMAAVKFCSDTRRKVIDASYATLKFDLPAPGEPRDRWLRTHETQALLDAAARLRRGDRLSRAERFLWLALETAGRKEAILDLTWDRVDFETGMIVFDVPGRRKTKKRRAVVPISSALRPVLKRAFDERTGPLVLDNKGAVWAQIQHIAMEAGLAPKQDVARTQKPKSTGISPHVLRHTAATHMARRGVSLFKIAKVLGNTVAVVEKTYAKHIPDDLKEAVDLISNSELEAAE